jgi:hypothetical protein
VPRGITNPCRGPGIPEWHPKAGLIDSPLVDSDGPARPTRASVRGMTTQRSDPAYSNPRFLGCRPLAALLITMV